MPFPAALITMPCNPQNGEGIVTTLHSVNFLS